MKAVKIIVGILGIVAAAVIALEVFAFEFISGLISGIFTAQIGLKTGLVMGGASLVASVLSFVFLKNRLIGLIAGILYLIGAAVGFYKSLIVTERVYEDALIWGIVLAVLGVAAILLNIFQKQKRVPARKR